MSLLNIFKSQLSSVIEWKDQNFNTIWYKHPSDRDEIINASKLIIAPGQGCILVYEGKIANALNEPGIYNLKTDNHPFLTTLANLRQNFNSEHKLYIYFYSTADILNQSWGTSNPIKYIDPSYKIPIELGLHGSYTFKIDNPAFFFTNIASNQTQIEASALKNIIINRIPQIIASILADKKIAYTEIDAHLNNLSTTLSDQLKQEFQNLGLQLIDFKILGTQFDEKTMDRIGSIADMTSQNMAAKEVGMSYEELEKLRALRDAARNEGGLAGIGAQLGVGMEIGKQFELQKDKVIHDNQNSSEDYVLKLQKLSLLLKENIITQAEFDSLKAQILSKI